MVDIKFIKRNLLVLIVGIIVYFLMGILLEKQLDVYDLLMFAIFLIVIFNIAERISKPKKGEA